VLAVSARCAELIFTAPFDLDTAPKLIRVIS